MKMENQTAKVITTILGVLGIVLILAGPAYVLLLPVRLKDFLRKSGNKHLYY